MILPAAMCALLAEAGVAQVADLGAARARWEAAALDDYVYEYRKYCECTPNNPPESTVTVSAGKVSHVSHRRESGFEYEAGPQDLQWYWTIQELFGLIERADALGAVVRVQFDPALGFPAMLFIDYDANFFGDEIDLRLAHVGAIAR